MYQQYPPSADGTGKVYMGREIAPVMGYQGAAWLERADREKEERTDILMRVLNLKKGMVVADIGAGTGYLSRRMADDVGMKGTVYAVDVQPEMISRLNSISKKYTNIKPVLSEPSDIKLAENTGARGALVLTGYGRETLAHPKRWPCAPEFTAENLLEAVKRILDSGLAQS